MKLKYLYSINAGNTEEHIVAEEGEPVIPDFPLIPNIDRFISTISFKPAYFAIVRLQELDVDEMLARCIKTFSELPASLLEAYILKTTTAAAKYDEGTILHVKITTDTASVTDLHDTKTVTLWNTQPI